MSATQTLIFPDLETLSRAAAVVFAQATREAVVARGKFVVAISGGETPQGLFRILGGSPYRDYLPWREIHVFWVDERCVEPQHPQSNYGQAWKNWLSHVQIPAGNIHRIPGELEPTQAVEKYEQELGRFGQTEEEWPAFDLVLLGLGRDGHIASLFPGCDQINTEQPVIQIEEGIQGIPIRRISMTPRVINRARQVVFLVSGESKQAALIAARDPSSDPKRWPARTIHPQNGMLVWMVDEAVAGDLAAGKPAQ